MIDLSMALGNIIKPTDRRITFVRDRAAKVATASRVRSYFEDMRFKPMPRYSQGAVVDQETLNQVIAPPQQPQSNPKLIPSRNALQKNSPVGRSSFSQQLASKVTKPSSTMSSETDFDTFLGIDPARLFTADQLHQFDELGVQLVCAVSPRKFHGLVSIAMKAQVQWLRSHLRH